MYQIGYKKMTKWWLATAVVVALLLILYFTGGLAFVASIFTKIFAPAQRAFYTAGLSAEMVKSKKDLASENLELKKKVEQQVLDSSRLKSLEIENQTLKEQLNFLEEHPYNFVVSRIISYSSINNLSAIIINRGKKNGVDKGLPVIVGEGVLIGSVVEAKDNTATVLLLSDEQSRIAATVQNKNQTIGIVEGDHGISVKMEKIPRNEEIKEGDTIVTSGLQDRIPRGLLVGTIEKIDTSSSELFSLAYINPLADYKRLSIVTVLIP